MLTYIKFCLDFHMLKLILVIILCLKFIDHEYFSLIYCELKLWLSLKKSGIKIFKIVFPILKKYMLTNFKGQL